VARPAFILTKLLSNTIGALIFIVALPGLVALGEIYLATHKMVPLLPFLIGSGIVLLGLIFYISPGNPPGRLVRVTLGRCWGLLSASCLVA